MGRKKKTEEVTEICAPSGLASKEVRKKFGDDVLIDGRFLLDHPKEIIPLSPAFDPHLGGGFQVGSFVVLAGQPRCGKTSTAMHFAIQWQKTGRKVVYINAESRLEQRNVNLLPFPEELIIVQHHKGHILTAQDFLSIALTYLRLEQEHLIIIDSLSVLSEERELQGGMGTETRGGSARLMAQFCRQATPIIPVNNHVVIGVAQLYANTSGQGRKYIVSMGRKVDYALYTLLYATHSKNWTVSGDEEDKNLIGQMNFWRVERSPIAPPGGELTSYLRYGHGIDETQEYLQYAADLSLIEKNGSWYYYPSKEDAQVYAQGAENFRTSLLENTEAFESLKKRIRELAFE